MENFIFCAVLEACEIHEGGRVRGGVVIATLGRIRYFVNIQSFWNLFQEIVSKFPVYNRASLSELINYNSPWNHQKIYGFLMISGGIEIK